MYVPPHFAESDQTFIKDFVRKHSFGLLVTWDGKRPLATQLLFNPIESGSDILLFGHLSRSNPQWKTFEQTPEALAVLEGPHAYISAGWYSIHSAPTWNYVTVQMYGIPQVVENNDEVYRLLRDLVDFQEQSTPEGERYRIESMPKDLLDNMVKAVVGFTIKVTKVECVAKLSQNRNARDYENIITKLKAQGDSNARAIAELMESRRGMSEK
jgi:transcriptional regulator